MSTTEERMKSVLDAFERRMDKLENPESQVQPNPGPAKQAEDDFINEMREINAAGTTDQAGDVVATDEETFIQDLREINEQPADNQ